MTSITLFDSVILDAAEGPMGLRVWPADALEKTLKAYRKRIMLENGYHVRFDGSRRLFNKPMAGIPSPKRKGRTLMKEGINQIRNRGMR